MKKRVCFKVVMFADTARPSVMAENLTAQINHALASEGVVILPATWAPVPNEALEAAQLTSDAIKETLEGESVLRKVFPAQPVDSIHPKGAKK